MTKGFRVIVVAPREKRVEVTAWPIHPKSLIRLSRAMHRRRNGYVNPSPHARGYRRRFVRNRRRRS